MNSGQTCSALTRMLVPRARLSEAEKVAAKTAAGLIVGSPFAAETDLGPLASEAQRARVRDLIEVGLAEDPARRWGSDRDGCPEGASTSVRRCSPMSRRP